MDYRVGDKLIQFGEVFRIFEIKPSGEGPDGTVICFKPYYKNRKNNTMTCSIPVKNIGKTRIRKPINDLELKGVYKELTDIVEMSLPFDLLEARDTLKLNDPIKTAAVLKRLWFERENGNDTFSLSKREVLETSMARLVEEVALVAGITIERAQETIEKCLKNGTKRLVTRKN